MNTIHNTYKAFLTFIKLHKIWSVLIGLLILVVVFYSTTSGKKTTNTSFALVTVGMIKEEVSVTGNVRPLSDVDLAFEHGGRVAIINVVVGDKVKTGETLASVSNDDLVANLNQAQANLKKVEADFGTNADQKSLDFVQSQTLLINSIKNSYTVADDALRNKIYSLFTDPYKYNAKLSFDSDIHDQIERDKSQADDNLLSWYKTLGSLNTQSDLESAYTMAKNNLDFIKSLLDKSATALSGVTASNSNVSQVQIDTWKTNIASARTNVNAAIDNLTSAFNQYKDANLSLTISKHSTLAEEADIEQAQAQVASAEAELSKSIIHSPIEGVVTDIPIKLGEIVPANQKALSVISYGDYEIESFIPEADISKIKIGNMASTTLDAYGNDVNFETTVIKIDPAATIIDGVATYKVTLKFINQDDRVRSGMTANLDILTAEKDNVLIVPARAVYTKEDGKYIKVLDTNDVAIEKKIEVGLRGVDGNVEVTSGLSEGDKVSTAL